MKSLRNIPASVRQRIHNRSKREDQPFSELLLFFAMERFLYRLSRSAYARRFILKGALMLQVWRPADTRATKDIDLLGRTPTAEAELVAQIREILNVAVEPDGIAFDPDSIRAAQIAEAGDYVGIRIRFSATLDSAKIPLQIDIGFGDPVHPKPKIEDFPTMLDFPAPRLLCYSRESSIAEKTAAMVKLGRTNSRMKDFYDIWLLSRQFDFQGAELAEAVRRTFEQRGTEPPPAIKAFTKTFVESNQARWSAYRSKLRLDHAPPLFEDIVNSVSEFLYPVLAALSSGKPCPLKWTAPGPWTSVESGHSAEVQ